MIQRWGSILAGLLMVLGIATGVLWIRSMFVRDRLIVSHDYRSFTALEAEQGILRIIYFSDRRQMPKGQWAYSSVSLNPLYGSSRDWIWAARRHSGISVSAYAIPIWLPAVAFIAFPLWKITGRNLATEKSPAPNSNLASDPVQPISRDDVECPLCGYNLRGITTPRCPECGYAFDWDEILDPTRRVHPYLFEQVRRSPVAAFFKTLTRNFEPNRFWKTLHPGQPLDARRLMLYALLCSIVALSPTFLGPIFETRAWASARGPFAAFSWWDSFARTVEESDGPITYVCVVMALYPLVTWLALMLFQESMRRARVLPRHVIRCAVYSADAIIWNTLWILAAVAIVATPWFPFHSLNRLIEVGVLATMILTTFRLASAYRHYMKFPHAGATAVASQVLVFLFVAVCSIPFLQYVFR